MTTEHASIPPHLLCLDPNSLPPQVARLDYHKHELSSETAARVEDHRKAHKNAKRKQLRGSPLIPGTDSRGRPIAAKLAAIKQDWLKQEAAGGLHPCIAIDAHVAAHPALAQYLRSDSEWNLDLERSGSGTESVKVRHDEAYSAPHLIWERHHGKPFPHGKAISLKDRNVLNLSPENFNLVDRVFPYEHAVTGIADSDKTPLDAETLARVRPLQDADVTQEQIKYLPIERGHLEGSGTPVSTKMLSGYRHPETGRLQFAIAPLGLIEAVVRDYPDHAWNLKQRPNGHFILRVKRTITHPLGSIVFEIAHGLPVPKGYAVAHRNGNPLDLRSDNLVLYHTGQGRRGGNRKG